MGIKEVYNTLITQEGQKETLRKIEDNFRKPDELRIRKYKEWRGEWKKQLILLKDLQRQGVIGLIEDFTDEQLKLVGGEDGIERVSIERPWRRDWGDAVDSMHGDELDQYMRREVWDFETYGPHLRRDGMWDQNFRMKIAKVNLELYPMGSWRREGIVLLYSPSRELTIMGDKVVFKGPLPIDQESRTKLVEQKIGQALIKPMDNLAISRNLYPDVYRK